MRPLAFLRRTVDRIALRDRSYAWLFSPDTSDEVVSVDCETTGFDPWHDDIVSIAAVKIRGGRRILASEAFVALVKPEARITADSIKVHQIRRQDAEAGRPIREVLPEFLRFVGSRPLVGYWIDFDCRMIDKPLIEMLNIHLPNPRIEVSSLYYDRKYGHAHPGTEIDLRFASIMRDLGLPGLPQHNALNDALVAAEMYVVLRDMAERGVRIPRQGPTAERAPLGG